MSITNPEREVLAQQAAVLKGNLSMIANATLDYRAALALSVSDDTDHEKIPEEIILDDALASLQNAFTLLDELADALRDNKEEEVQPE